MLFSCGIGSGILKVIRLLCNFILVKPTIVILVVRCKIKFHSLSLDCIGLVCGINSSLSTLSQFFQLHDHVKTAVITCAAAAVLTLFSTSIY